MDTTIESPVILSLCTGMRGLERGIERAIGRGLRTAAYVEIEAFIIENLVQQMEQGVLAPAPVWSNLKTFPSEQFHGKIHGIIGGYPCQPFSVAGKRNGTEDPRHLWPHIKRMVGAIRPVWCFFENVPGHLTLGYREVRSDLERLGYTVEEGIFSAEEVGAPHQRKRLFILALDNTYIKRWKHEQEGFVKTVFEKERNLESASEIGGSIKTRDGGCETGQKDGEQLEGCCELANTSLINIQGNIGELPNTKIREESRERQVRSQGIRDRWPARPGEQQYGWEQPRVESRWGFTINGYNFREDLLRMAGNGVVEQVSEKAWITLWNKFL